MSDETGRISVSRDALRADLAEMELRLRTYFDERISHTASAESVRDVSHRLGSLERGEFNEAQTRTIRATVETVLSEESAAAWSPKERLLAMLSTSVALAMLVLSVILAIHGGGALL